MYLAPEMKRRCLTNAFWAYMTAQNKILALYMLNISSLSLKWLRCLKVRVSRIGR